MKALIVAALLTSTTIACAQPAAQQAASLRDISVSLSPDDQKIFKEVCAMAMRNPALPIETTYGVSTWCVNMNAKIVQAQQAPPAEKKPE
jgi:uncharacterized lipoprotein YajG